MKLPDELGKNKEWTIVGPMGPEIGAFLLNYPVIAVDGGAHFTPKMDLWIGDGDSNTSQLNCKHIFKFAPKKNSSDFSLTLSFFDPSQRLILHAWGFRGGRLDHELITYGEALSFLEKSPGSQIYFYTEHSTGPSMKCLGKGEWTFTHKGLFSLAALKAAEITIKGDCEYQLDQLTELTPLSSLGLSNSATGEFKVTCTSPIMIFFPEIH